MRLPSGGRFLLGGEKDERVNVTNSHCRRQVLAPKARLNGSGAVKGKDKTMTDNTTMIRKLNDRFRTGDKTIPGSWMMTAGVQVLLDNEAGKAKLISMIADFNAFDEDNDPHHEHDFGAFDFAGQRLFWKIDHYARGMMHGSEDPADVTNTIRVLTIMRADEY